MDERKGSQESKTESPAESESEKADVPTKVPLHTLFRYASRTDLCLLFLGIFVSCLTGAGLPLMSILQGKVSQSFVDEQTYKEGLWDNATRGFYDESKFSHDVMNIVYAYAGMAVAVFLAANLQVTCFLIVCEQISNRLRRRFMAAILRQDIPWFDKNNSGTLAPKLFDNLERVKEGTGDKIGLMFQYLSQFIAGFVIAFCHSWKMTLIMLAFTPLQVLAGFLIGKTMSTYTQAESIKYATAGTIVEQAITSIRTVQALNGLEYEMDRYGEAVASVRRAGVKKNLVVGLAFCLMGFVNFVSFAVAFYVGVSWVHNGQLQLSELMTTFFSVMMGSLALGQAGPQFAVLGAAQGAAASVYEVIDRNPEIDASSSIGRRDFEVKGNISIEHLVFRYPSRPKVQVLNSISMTVSAGETIALVGSSGCGKSTMVSLLLRYYDVEEGKISIDGVPITDINIEFLRNQIAVVSQEPVLFNCSIEENIKFGRSDITEKEMIAACKMANAHKFISGLPMAYQTLVGDRGMQLSGGQKQRIAIARALVRNPKILLLDEATSALDAESEGVVQAALDKASKGRTTIIIAHRLSTIRNADKIIVMKAGQVCEIGTHQSLLASKGLYYDLVHAQTFTDAIDDVTERRRTRQGSVMGEITDRRRTRQGSLLDDVTVRRRVSTAASMDSVSQVAERIRSTTLMAVREHDTMEEVDNAKMTQLERLKMEFKEEKASKTNLFEILGYAGRSWLSLTIGIIACLLGGFVFPIYSVLFTEVINVFSDPATLLSKGHFWALMFLALAVFQAVTMFAEVFFMGVSSENLAADLRNGIFRNILSQDMSFFDSPLHASGKLCTRLASDVPNLRSALDFRFATVLDTFVSIGAGIALAFFYGWKMAFLAVGFLPILACGQALRSRVIRGKHRQTAKHFEESGKVAMEAIEHVRTVQALTRESAFYEKFCDYLDGPHKDAVQQAFIQGLAYGFASSVVYILNCVCYRLGLFLILSGQMMPIQVLRVMYAISISATTLGFATSYFPEYMKARLAGGIIFNMLRQTPNIDNLTEEGKMEKLSGAVTFSNVRFSYPERASIEILKGLSFSVRPGETLALVGPSGCGKSTVVSLIERFYDVTQGQILLDSHDLRTLNPQFTRRQIAIVSQEPILFDASIAENICYGMADSVGVERIEAAAKKANIHKFISELPNGYETRVGDKGTQLSGGQKQRIAIARALVRDPKILLLDEATSALDTESEKIVQEALDRAREGRTCIVIAHRLSTVVNADTIAVVKEGIIVEQGSHSELISKRGAYYALTQKQTISATNHLSMTEENVTNNES